MCLNFRCQSHPHFMSSFFVQKPNKQLFCICILGLNVFWRKEIVQGWWNVGEIESEWLKWAFSLSSPSCLSPQKWIWCSREVSAQLITKAKWNTFHPPTKALQNNFCFGKALLSRVTSTTHEYNSRNKKKLRLNSLYNKFGRYVTSFIIIFVI